jgi:hypothetical protein
MGACAAGTVDFTYNDWYMSHDVVRVLETYRIPD